MTKRAARRPGAEGRDLDRILSALADRTRRNVIDLLLHGPERPAEIADRLGVSRPALSRHLRVLREAALISDEGVDGDARGRRCVLEPDGLGSLRGWLDQAERMWESQLTAFKAYAERAVKRGDRG